VFSRGKLRGLREKRKPTNRRRRMTIEIRVRSQNGDVTVEREARVTYCDDYSSKDMIGKPDPKEKTLERIKDILAGLGYNKE
jgi:hypothetical protein